MCHMQTGHRRVQTYLDEDNRMKNRMFYMMKMIYHIIPQLWVGSPGWGSLQGWGGGGKGPRGAGGGEGVGGGPSEEGAFLAG